jgi:hypothetical protein
VPRVEGELGGVLEEGEKVRVGRESEKEKRKDNAEGAEEEEAEEEAETSQAPHAEPACGAATRRGNPETPDPRSENEGGAPGIH